MTSIATYECTAELIDSSDSTNYTSRLDGELSVTASSSVCEFLDLRVENAGVYIVRVTVEATYSTSSYTQVISSSSFPVTSSIKSVTITERSIIDQYEDYTYVITVLGENGYDFLDGYNLTITANDSSSIGGLTGLNEIYTSSKTLSLYFTTSGYMNITVEAKEIVGSSEGSVEQSFYLNPAYFEINSISVIQN